MGEHLQRPLQLFSREKLSEFSDMTIKARLQWLEEANTLAMKVLGPVRRATSDSRFEVNNCKW